MAGLEVEVEVGGQIVRVPGQVIHEAAGADPGGIREHLLAALPVDSPPDIRRFLTVGLEAGSAGLTVDQVVTLTGSHRRTLSDHAHRAHLRPPAGLLRACRLLRAASLVAVSGFSVERAALESGMGRAATFRRQLRQAFGLTPGTLRPSTGGGGTWLRVLERLPNVLLALASALLWIGLPTGAAFAQVGPSGTVTGRVTDAVAGTALAGATVAIEGRLVGTTTDEQGRFLLTAVAAGPQVLRVVRIGYAPLRRSIIVPRVGGLTVDIGLAKSALNLPNLVVTADPSSRARGELGTASVIGSEAIKHQAAASLAGLLELVPGVTLAPPGLDGVQQFSLRSVPVAPAGGAIGVNPSGPSANSLAAFGTQIVLDGIPVSNNVNLQSLGSRAELGFASSVGGGIDLRRIPAATLERVEVIRGIPSARFGDLTQGVVLIDTRAGVVDPEVRVRFDVRTVEATLLGGAALSSSQVGTASVNLARTRLAPGARDDIGSRISAQLAHRVTGPTVTLDSRLDFFQVLEDEPESPLFPNIKARSRDNGLRVSERLRWQIRPATRLDWTTGYEADQQQSFTQSPRLRGAAPFTNRLTEGTQDGKFVGGQYIARVDVDGSPKHLYSRIEATRAGLRTGLELRREWNQGPGFQFDIEFPPQVDFNGVQGYDRPRRFDAIPPLVTSAFYIDHRLSRTIGGALVNLQTGARLDVLHRGGSWLSAVRDRVVQPRIQVEVEPWSRFRVRAGVGRLSKVPSLGDLSPGRQYYDLVNFNYYANVPAERRAIVTTRILDRDNPALRMSRADKFEVGAEIDFGAGGQVALTAYTDRITDAVGLTLAPTFLIRDRFLVDSATIGTGRPPAVQPTPFARDTIPTLIDRPANNLDLRSRGIELSALLPEFRPLRTRVAIQGAWASSRLASTGIELGNDFTDFQLTDRVSRAPYWEAVTRYGERMVVTTRLIHQQPKAGLVITGTLQYTVREIRKDIGGADTLAFAGYLSRDGRLVAVPASDRTKPEFSDLRVPRRGLIEAQRAPADWLFSLQVAKTLPFGGRLAFYAFNAFDRVGSYGGAFTVPRLYPTTRFGLELTMPLLGAGR